MIVKEVYAKGILSKSKVFDYTINPYIGCEHGCTYCYARFMKRFTGHSEKWGEFVDVKVNAPQLLQREIKKKQVGRVWVSGVCDPYQPFEKEYEITRSCLEILLEQAWPVTIQTKSPLVIRDLDLLRKSNEVEVGFTITTSNDSIREIFEFNSPKIDHRIDALKELHSIGVKTFAMIAPMLPEAEGLVAQLHGKVHYVLVDKMNYHYADKTYRKYGLEYAMSAEFFAQKKKELVDAFKKEEMQYRFIY